VEIKTLFGLPAHPLLVHVPIVLIPLVGVGAVWIALSAKARERFGTLVLGGAVVAFVGTWLAVASGGPLEESVKKSAVLREHVDLADKMRPLALLLVLAVLALVLLDRRTRAGRTFPPIALRGAAAVMVVVAVGVTGWLVAVGHNGARATWQQTHIKSSDGDQGLGRPSSRR
jgi:uncharacterized membrane protein